MATNMFPVCFCGPTGTGKSVYVKNWLAELSTEKFNRIELGFSAKTSENMTQDLVDKKLDKKGRGTFGPQGAQGCKLLLFVDDMNMPKKENYGAQPPIEILRQLIDNGGWYDRSERTWKKIVDTTIMAAMGVPGGGKEFITPRFLRHFHMITFTDLEDDSMQTIFDSILRQQFTNQNFSGEVTEMSSRIVKGTIEVYNNISTTLKPTPMKVHYTFNLRDFAKVIFGCCLINPKTIDDPLVVSRLWVHEVLRVFQDRLINEADRMWMVKYMTELFSMSFGRWDDLLKHLDNNGDGKVNSLEEVRSLIFTDILSPSTAMVRPYVEILNLEELKKAAEYGLDG